MSAQTPQTWPGRQWGVRPPGPGETPLSEAEARACTWPGRQWGVRMPANGERPLSEAEALLALRMGETRRNGRQAWN